MSKFYSFGHRSYGGEGVANVPSAAKNPKAGSFDSVPLEKLQQAYPDFYKNQDGGAPSTLVEVGDEIKMHGDTAKVLHSESNQDGSVDVTVQRSVRGNSGTYQVKAEPAPNKRLVVTKSKRTFD